MNGNCQYHNMIAFKHLLSANAEHLLFCHLATTLCNKFALSAPPFIIMQNTFRTRNAWRKIVPALRYFDTKIFSHQSWKAPCHSFLITASVLSVQKEANSPWWCHTLTFTKLHWTLSPLGVCQNQSVSALIHTDKGNLKLWKLIVFKVKETALCFLILIAAESSKTMEKTSFHIPILRC